MPTPNVAVILAAGRGSRMGERTRTTPKALLPLGPRSLTDPTPTCFLRRQVEVLLELGVDEVVVVIGELGDIVAAAVADWRLPVSLVTNTAPDIAASGSLHSMWFAMHSPHDVLDGERRTWLLDGDIAYHRDVVRAMLGAPDRTCLLLTPDSTGDAEEVRVYGTAERPVAIGKGLSEVAVGAPCLGEATGIVMYAPADHAAVRATIERLIPARPATEHEELSGDLMAQRLMGTVMLAPGTPFTECDDEADYARVLTEFYPALLRADG